MSIIQVKNLSKVYDIKTIPVHALSNVNIEFNPGDFAAIVGPSGSGKTTLLNILGGLDDPLEGSVFVENIEINKLPQSKRTEFRLKHIGFVFQAYNLLPVLTARENIEFIMQLQKIPAAKRKARAMELLQAVGIADKSEVRPAKLSGGQQQRVAVARALASKPRYVLADEPTANLDSKSTEALLDIMEKLNKEEGVTFIFATHDQRVMNKARRVITMVDGRIVNDSQNN